MQRSPPSAGWSDCSITSLTGAPRMSWSFVTRITAMSPCTDSDGRVPMRDLLITIDTEPDLPKRRTPSTGTLTNIPALLTLQQQIPNVKLTLLATHSVVTSDSSLRILERLK